VQRADVVFASTDVVATILGTQDFKIAETAIEAGKALFFVVNKWDLIEKDEKTAGIYVNDLRVRAHSFSWAPIVFISALTGQRAVKILEMAREVLSESRKRVPTAELNDVIQKDMMDKPPPAIRGTHIKIKYITQTEAAPPTFVVFVTQIDRRVVSTVCRHRIRERYGLLARPSVSGGAAKANATSDPHSGVTTPDRLLLATGIRADGSPDCWLTRATAFGSAQSRLREALRFGIERSRRLRSCIAATRYGLPVAY
jgi:hypothetical protein